MRSYRDSLIAKIDNVSKATKALPFDSSLRHVWDDCVSEKVRQCVNNAGPDDLTFMKLPPLFILLDGMSQETIVALDKDLRIVADAASSSDDPLTQTAKNSPMDDRKWCGALFEVYVKSVFLKHFSNASLDYILPNGKDVDVRITLGTTPVLIECTVITDSEEDRYAFDKFTEAKKDNNDAVLIRPGPFDKDGSKGPSIYYDMLRVYAKVYDKLAPSLDTEKSQISTDNPNILFLSFFTPKSSLNADSPSVGFALDELFVAQPRGHIPLKSSPGGISGVSLQDWLDHRAKELISEQKIDYDYYADSFDSLIEAPRGLGAIVLFEDCAFAGSRVNYNANRENVITHVQIVSVEELFAIKPLWRR